MRPKTINEIADETEHPNRWLAWWPVILAAAALLALVILHTAGAL